MSTIIDTLITDRTQADVDLLIALLKAGTNPIDHKGSYNASDLNRVANAIEYLAERFELIGINANTTIKNDWDYTDIPTIEYMEQYLAGIKLIKLKIKDYRSNVDVPDSMKNLSYDGANKIEKILMLAEDVITNIILSYRGYSGRQISGVNNLP